MSPRLSAAVAVAALIAAAGSTVAAQSAEPRGTRQGSAGPASGAEPVRFFFIADVHSRHDLFERILRDAERERPEFVLEGGDFVHDGTASEFRRAYADRARLPVPWRVAKGNHDARRRGPHPEPPPPIPELDVFTHGGVRFILLDNHRQLIPDALFDRLEAELAAHDGGSIIVVMHVPPVLSREPFMTRLRHLVPYPVASPTMRDPEQVERFMALISRHDVLAVLTGHAHFPDEYVRDGVRYIVAGTAGGLRPGFRFRSEYLDVTIDGREITYRRVPLEAPTGNPVTFIVEAFRFFAHVNGLSHADQGWNFVPSSSVQLRSGLALTEARGGENVAVFGATSFERVLGPVVGRHALFADLGLSAAPRELAGHFLSGYKLRPVGDFNENAFVSGAATANIGMLRGSGTAGLGLRLGVGFEWRSVTAEMSRNWATNHRATSLVIGHRY